MSSNVTASGGASSYTDDPGVARPHKSIIKGLVSVNKRISSAHLKCGLNASLSGPRLVAVSKTKPVEMILCAYQQGQRHFGENFVQELADKSQHPLLLKLEDISWHFIGHLQRNKCNNLVACPHLYAVETIDSQRLASALDTAWGKRSPDKNLKVFVQVNTSGEDSKHGSTCDEEIAIAQHIISHCTNLKFLGLMTIGRIGHDYSIGPNPDYGSLVETRVRLCTELDLSVDEVELSMGMSADFEQAIGVGSTNVRVGSEIFGARESKVL